MREDRYEVKDILKILTVLDCILDSSFETLAIDLPFSAFNSFSPFMSILTHRSQELKELQIRYLNAWNRKVTIGNIAEEKTSSLLLPNQGVLRCLTSLTIDHELLFLDLGHRDALRESQHRSVLSIIGKCCPVLTKLTINNMCMRKKDVLGLIIDGEMANILFPRDFHGWGHDSIFGGLRVPVEFMNPICFTLQELSLDCGHHNYPKHRRVEYGISPLLIYSKENLFIK